MAALPCSSLPANGNGVAREGTRLEAWPSRHYSRAFVGFLRSLSTNRQAQKQLGYKGQYESWVHLIRKSIPLAGRVEELAPALCDDGPNPEYPWPKDAPQVAPVEYTFDIWRELQETAVGRQFLNLVGRLFAVAEAFL